MTTHLPSRRRAPGLLWLSALLFATLCTQARGWGTLGHEVAGELCERLLSDPARVRVRDLLGREPLAEASHWADRMRDDPAPFWQQEAGPYHYVTVPAGRRYAAVGPPRQGDALSALTMFRDELNNPGVPRARQQLALRFAVHIIQDLQQPLHTGNGRDRGGNDIAVRVNGEPSNLHRVWDAEILHSAGRDRREWLRHLDRRGLLRRANKDDAEPLVWVRESAASRDRLYPPHRNWSSADLRRALPVAEERLALAGLRCAAWLNRHLVAASGRVPDAADTPSWWRRLFDR